MGTSTIFTDTSNSKNDSLMFLEILVIWIEKYRST